MGKDGNPKPDSTKVNRENNPSEMVHMEAEKPRNEPIEKEIERQFEKVLERKFDQEIEVIKEQIISWKGPLPPPEIMGGFEKVVPGAADRILAMTEKQGDHRREMEKILARHTFFSTTIGQAFALIAMLALVASGTVCIASAIPWNVCTGWVKSSGL